MQRDRTLCQKLAGYRDVRFKRLLTANISFLSQPVSAMVAYIVVEHSPQPSA
ncbi:MAG: hypothetical protein ABL921_00120 [Pirellula sp.]